MTKKFERVWIMGAGKFGRISAEALIRAYPQGIVIVVDVDPGCLAQMADLPVQRVREDGVAFLNRNLEPAGGPDWIIPVIPVHVAAEWVAAQLSRQRGVLRMPVPDAALDRLPNPTRGAGGDVYTSLADFVCPEDCPQPSAHCTHTREPRPYNLYDHLAALRSEGFRSIVIVSRQLAPGVGGLAPGDMFRALEEAQAQPGPFLISTACRCHGVVSAFGFRS